MDFSLLRELLRETSIDVASFVFVSGIFCTLIWLSIILIFEIIIEWIEKKRQKEINNYNESIKNTGTMQESAEQMLRSIKKKYQPSLGRLNRKRKFMLERLPFFKN